MPLRNARRYNPISVCNEGDAVGAVNNNNENSINSNSLSEPLSPTSPLESNGENQSSYKNPPINNVISVVLLDGAQTKFIIPCDPHWKVIEFKSASSQVTKVPPESQRLIHMGKLLQDDKTLEECGIHENDKIVHLFPKPNIVIVPPTTSSSSSSSFSHSSPTISSSIQQADESRPISDNNNVNIGSGAHVPQIVINAEEASHRAQILILSSQEIFEAQHRVKIFSFLLMIIASMELLTLMTLFLGVEDESYGGSGSSMSGGEIPPGNPTDIPPSSENVMPVRTWQNSDYADAAISAFGFYVSLLGIKATTENTLRLARQYMICLLIAGIASNCYYYFLNLQQMERTAHERNQTLDYASKYGGSFVGILLPLTVWTLCIIRAYQFQLLIQEAEMEAEERTQNFQRFNDVNHAGEGVRRDANSDEGSSPSLPYGTGESGASLPVTPYNDLELQVERGVST